MILSFLCSRHAARHPTLRLPLTVYLGAYALTTGLGAILIGLLGPEVLPTTWGMDLDFISEIGPQYWLLAFVPFVIPPLVAAYIERHRAPAPPPAQDAALSLPAVIVTFAACAGYCGYRLLATGYAASLADIDQMAGDFQGLMVLRSDMMLSLGTFFFGFVYTTLPAICHVMLYLAVKRRQPWIWAVYGVMLATTAFLCIAVVQKTLIMVLLGFTAVALVELGVVSWRIFGLVAIGGVALLSALQLIYQGESWTALDSLALLIFRMSSSFPYYVNLYPGVLPYGGVDLGLNVFGIGEAPRDPLDVHEHIYPSVNIEGAAAPAAAHVRAYSQAGLPWALVTAVGIGIVVYFVARSRSKVRGPLSFALNIQLLVLLYYLTQTSAVEAITSSYGLIWTLFGLTSIAALDFILRRNQPEHAATMAS